MPFGEDIRRQFKRLFKKKQPAPHPVALVAPTPYQPIRSFRCDPEDHAVWQRWLYLKEDYPTITWDIFIGVLAAENRHHRRQIAALEARYHEVKNQEPYKP